MDLDVGTLVAGKYELVRLLGRGSMGEVWVAHHRTLGEKVALKLLTPAPPDGVEAEDPATAAARFLFEAQVAARLSRKTRHIVRVTDHGEDIGVAYLVMELLDGQTLESMIVRDGYVATATVVDVVRQVGRALTVAHAEGVLHRDLKPANVFLSRDEDGKLLVKLLDFGIARAIHSHKAPTAYATARGLVFGTPSYMSPEQARASTRLDHRCDLWALATIAYECIAGDLPLDGQESDELLKNLCAGRIVPLEMRRPGLGPALQAFFDKAFADSIVDRFASAADLVAAFEQASGGPAPVVAAPAAAPVEETPVPRSVDPIEAVVAAGVPRAGRARRAAVAVVVALASFVGIGLLWRNVAEPRAITTPAAALVTPSAAPPAAPLPPAVPPVTPAVTLADPAVPVSALPHAPRPPTAAAPAHGPTEGPAAGAPPPVAPGPATGAVVAPPPVPVQPAPALSPTSPPAASRSKVDKSEVL